MKLLIIPAILFSCSFAASGQITRTQATTVNYSQPVIPQPAYTGNTNNSYTASHTERTTPPAVVHHTNGSMVNGTHILPSQHNYNNTTHNSSPASYHTNAYHDGAHKYKPHRRWHYLETNEYYYPVAPCYNYVFAPGSWSYTTVNKAFNESYNGFVVYNNDTLEGIITLTNEKIYFEQPIDSVTENEATLQWSDKQLKSLVIYYNDHELFLTRPVATENALARVVHYGKVSVYDDKYSFFNNPQQIDTRKLRVQYDGKNTTVSKKELATIINNTYNAGIDPKYASWTDILLALDKLN